MTPRTILGLVGARPNLMKVAPLHRALEARDRFRSRIVHTGQHYGKGMSDLFFRRHDRGQPAPRDVSGETFQVMAASI